MLNTDAHNPQVKTGMAQADFIKNNRGINDGQDLPPEELLRSIHDDIVNNEIPMKDEVDVASAPITPAPGLANALAKLATPSVRICRRNHT